MARWYLRISVLLVVALAMGATVLGQAADASAPQALELRYFDFFVVKGGWIAYLIILLSVLMVALAIEYCLSVRRLTIVPPEVGEALKDLIDARDYPGALALAAQDSSMLGCVVHAALLEAANGFSAMERALEETIEDRSARLFRKIEPLNIIGNVSPMLGLFGTVVGMIMLFAEIHASAAFPPAQTVANAVAVALITTFWGLAVAIPSLSIHAIFRNRIDVLTAECALTAERILAVFKPGSAAGAPIPLGAVPAAPMRGQHAVRA